MNLSWLDDFLALAASGNFSRAAAERHMTQPAFSRRIRALEDWLGVPLFDRTTHPVALTETGRWFRRAAEEILARVARVPDEARAVAEGSASTLRFAATHALSLTFLPGWLRGVESRGPTGAIQLLSDVARRCEALMLQGSMQFMLCHTHPDVASQLDPDTFVSRRVGSDVLMPVCATNRAKRPRHRLTENGLQTVPLLAYSSESGLGRIVQVLRGRALAAARARPIITAHAATLLKAMALEGRGVAWLPRTIIEDDLHAHRLTPAGPPDWDIGVDIRLFRNKAPLPAAAEAFWSAVREES